MCLQEDVLASNLSHRLLVLLCNLEQLFCKYGPKTLGFRGILSCSPDANIKYLNELLQVAQKKTAGVPCKSHIVIFYFPENSLTKAQATVHWISLLLSYPSQAIWCFHFLLIVEKGKGGTQQTRHKNRRPPACGAHDTFQSVLIAFLVEQVGLFYAHFMNKQIHLRS